MKQLNMAIINWLEPTCLCSLLLLQQQQQQTLLYRVTSFKLLGVYIDSTMSWTIHVDNMVKKPLAGIF